MLMNESKFNCLNGIQLCSIICCWKKASAVKGRNNAKLTLIPIKNNILLWECIFNFLFPTFSFLTVIICKASAHYSVMFFYIFIAFFCPYRTQVAKAQMLRIKN